MNKIFLDHTSSNAFKLSDNLSDKIWSLVEGWTWFDKQTVGSQLVRSVDSIGANVAEGFGRFHKKDKQKFYYNARASVYETIFWIEKAQKRKLISPSIFKELIEGLKSLPKELNWLIRVTEQKLKD